MRDSAILPALIEHNDQKTIQTMEYVLKTYGIPAHYYSIGKYADESVCIERTRKGWTVFTGERGNRYDLTTHTNVFAACKQVLSRTAESDEQYEKMSADFVQLCRERTIIGMKKKTIEGDMDDVNSTLLKLGIVSSPKNMTARKAGKVVANRRVSKTYKRQLKK